ncbi:MAG: T9SS type A sorting domain-containing protein [Bacteroidales bacterium]|nr:T9SS type A sorting domain-containing protein [Bacteroidales bacterium]
MRFFTSVFMAIILLATNLVFGQYPKDNPNLDQVPQYLLERSSAVNDAPLSSIITVGNWDNFSLGVDFAESNIAMNPLQPTWLFTSYNTNATHHTENGLDWATNNPSFGATMRGDPVVAYDSLGNLFYENMYGSPSIVGCKVITSTTNGATWGSSVTAIAGVDKNWIACDQTSGPYANYVYTTMTNSSAGNFARSTNHGVSFTSTFAPATQSLPGMMVCVGPQDNVQGGAVYVVTNSGSSFAATYTFYRSNNGGATFSQRSSVQWANYVGTNVSSRNSVQNMRTRPYPMIAADNSYGPSRGTLYCVYASNTPSGNGNKPDIFSRYSSNGGLTWSGAVLVNDDPDTQNHHQWHPSVWCDKETGRLYVMWMDTRDTPTNDSAYIYASYSDNGGVSFTTNQRISNVKMKIDCSTCGGGGTPRYQGDYNGVVSNKKVSMIGWTDFRQGTFQSMTAYFPDFAMAIDHTTHSLYRYLDSATFIVSVPEVILYTDTVLLTTTISPTPSSGSITATYPSGNTITAFPGSKPVRLVLWGNVPAGNYTATFLAAGPNGTPVHRRTATITVLSGTNPQATVTLQPDRSRCVGDTVHIPIHVSGVNIHNMSFYISYDHANLAQTGAFYTSVHPSMNVSYNPSYNATTLLVTLTVNESTGLNLTNAKLIDLVFALTGAGSTQLHLRSTPDASPISGIWNYTGVLFNQVNYTDNTITVSAGPPVSISISASENPVFAGTAVTFTAVAINGGGVPFYQWKVNGLVAGTDDPTFVYIPADGDVVTCVMTSVLSCASGNPATSNEINMVVISVPQTTSLQNITIDDTRCYDALQTITISGSGSNVVMLNGSNVTLVAGENILLLPATTVNYGGYLSGYITTDGLYCGMFPPSIVTVVSDNTEQRIVQGNNPIFKIYPNPTSGRFILDFYNEKVKGQAQVEIYSSNGEKVLNRDLAPEGKHEFSLFGRPTGIYYIRVSAGNKVTVKKVILLW